VEKQEVAEENLVKKTCRELGITQKKLAEESGNSISSISKWSKGAKIPNSAIKSFELLIKNRKLNELVLKIM